MILFHILMFSQNSTFYIYIIYCQNAPWPGCLVRTISLSKDGQPPLKKENWPQFEEKNPAALNKFIYLTKK